MVNKIGEAEDPQVLGVNSKVGGDSNFGIAIWLVEFPEAAEERGWSSHAVVKEEPSQDGAMQILMMI